MTKHLDENDPYIGLQPIKDYYITNRINHGKIGIVYTAVRTDPSHSHTLACKVIPANNLRQGWERELQKVLLLNDIPGVVHYHSHGTDFDSNQVPFIWVLWDYVDGMNLRDYLDKPPWPLDMAFVEVLAKTILEVLHACSVARICHGDLHPGNILISNPDPRLLGSPRRIWISDFGYGGSHNDMRPKDDYRQFVSIVSGLLHKMEYASLNPRDRCMYHKLDEFLKRRMLETDPTQACHVGDSASLLEEFGKLGPNAASESADATTGLIKRDPGDYLWAEALGNRREEWRDLFVPNFLAAQDLLSRNITVLTGARGCGKTMAFRRLTAFMDNVIGEHSGVPGADQFVGFYLNCRDLVEAFPWLPNQLSDHAQQQIIHYFHLSWFTEVCKTIEIYDHDGTIDFQWLDKFAIRMFVGQYVSLPFGSRILAHIRAFLEDEKEKCRSSDLKKKANWALGRTDFLDCLQVELEQNLPWIGRKPLYMFVDDYTNPIVPLEVQRILNPIIFKRRSSLFFKISTEAANSFERKSLRGKPLELHQDFELIDLANESLHQDIKEKRELLDKIFRPRIDRHPVLTKRNLGLEDVLGKSPQSNNELALSIRSSAEGQGKKKILYHGINAFVGMWSSDTRTMIQMFTEMLRDANGQIADANYLIKPEIQNRIYRNAGGEFLGFAEAMSDPSGSMPGSGAQGQSYGSHLKDIVEAFIKVSRYELTKGTLVSNQGRQYPKQAFRLEIIDHFDISERAANFYEGLIRWHIFLQDWRGKSVRGMLTPRLYLNRILIPFCELTFSSHDNIQMTNLEFIDLLTKPKDFFEYWCNKRQRPKSSSHPSLGFDTQEESGEECFQK